MIVSNEEIKAFEERQEAISHPYGELQRYHLEALKNPLYRQELRLIDLEAQLEPSYAQEEHLNLLATKTTIEPEWIPRQWDKVNQLRAQVLYLHNKVTELLVQKPKRQSKYS